MIPAMIMLTIIIKVIIEPISGLPGPNESIILPVRRENLPFGGVVVFCSCGVSRGCSRGCKGGVN